MKRLLFILYLFLILPLPARAADSLEFGKISVAELEDIYDFYDYHGEKDYLMIPSYHYPPIFLRYFPTDFNKITDEKKRNAMFIKILAPLTIRLNDEILAERKEILAIRKEFQDHQELTKEQEKIIEEKAQKYDIFTRLKGYRRYSYFLDELSKRVHVIPPSILITAAALETNWGTSRIVKEGNSLYKALNWYSNEGLKPIGETEDDSYRIKTYPDIYSSIKEFALKLNSSISFREFRGFRDKILDRRTPLLGTMLAPHMVWNSPLQNYAGLFDYTLAYYELNIIDKSVLDSKMIEKPLPQKLQVLVM